MTFPIIVERINKTMAIKKNKQKKNNKNVPNVKIALVKAISRLFLISSKIISTTKKINKKTMIPESAPCISALLSVICKPIKLPISKNTHHCQLPIYENILTNAFPINTND